MQAARGRHTHTLLFHVLCTTNCNLFLPFSLSLFISSFWELIEHWLLEWDEAVNQTQYGIRQMPFGHVT